MKKLILLFFLILTLGGCYDYYELNDRAIVIGIGIDYIDNEYVITYEVISNNVDKEAANTKSYTITEKSKSFPRALDLASDVIPKRGYYSHADLLVLSEEVAQNHMEDILDYLLRNENIRETLNVIINKNPQELLSKTSESLAVVSSSINNAIDADKYSGSFILKKKYINMAREILSFGEDAAISIIDIDKDKINVQDLAVFNEYKMVGKLPKEDTALLNLINNETNNFIIDYDYDGKLFSNSLMASDIDITVDEKAIKVEGSVKAEVLENQPNFNLKDPATLEKLEDTFHYVLNAKITEFIEKTQKLQSDILYLGENYYIHTRDKNKNLWQTLKVTSDVKFNINKKGIIYEVQDAN